VAFKGLSGRLCGNDERQTQTYFRVLHNGLGKSLKRPPAGKYQQR